MNTGEEDAGTDSPGEKSGVGELTADICAPGMARGEEDEEDSTGVMAMGAELGTDATLGLGTSTGGLRAGVGKAAGACCVGAMARGGVKGFVRGSMEGAGASTEAVDNSTGDAAMAS
jgi:hypothetical protein